ncbi:hypothetical protein AG1IA_02763 [Rhizoctonia solani AG-1 IA]|uniref:Uncharacterized protein n=1 Tax=Thanatephorus cucumeris (strain AG1-IA) TaxID=983506 RepID=L8WYR4_THACA|nr:hypothetical protein AG1IA_02763 [Rhizoctonia solani AG-1 IA]
MGRTQAGAVATPLQMTSFVPAGWLGPTLSGRDETKSAKSGHEFDFIFSLPLRHQRRIDRKNPLAQSLRNRVQAPPACSQFGIILKHNEVSECVPH